jgi:hypothetical protein
MKRLILLFVIVLVIVEILCLYGNADAESDSCYTTWENMEPDKCASAWLIKRFIDKNATFEFFPKGELITKGILFDVPEAEIRRYNNISTFEYLIKKISDCRSNTSENRKNNS